VQDFLTASFDHSHIERFNLHLLEHLRRIRSGPREWSLELELLRMTFEREALECPGSSGFDLLWHGWQWHYPTDVSNRIILLVRKACHVVLNAFMPGNQGGCTQKAPVAMGRNQPAAGKS